MLRIQLEEEERSFIRMTQNQSIFLIATKVATLQLTKLNNQVSTISSQFIKSVILK